MNLLRHAIYGPETDAVPTSEQRRLAAREIEAGLADLEAERAAAARLVAEEHAAAIRARRAGDRTGALAHLEIEKGQRAALATYDRARKRLLEQRVAQARRDSTAKTAQIMRRTTAAAAGFSDTVDELDDAVRDQDELDDNLGRADTLLEGDPMDDDEADALLAGLDSELLEEMDAMHLDAVPRAKSAPAPVAGFALPPNPARPRPGPK